MKKLRCREEETCPRSKSKSVEGLRLDLQSSRFPICCLPLLLETVQSNGICSARSLQCVRWSLSLPLTLQSSLLKPLENESTFFYLPFRVPPRGGSEGDSRVQEGAERLRAWRPYSCLSSFVQSPEPFQRTRRPVAVFPFVPGRGVQGR